MAKIVPIVNPSWLPFRVCSNDHAQLTGMPYIFFFKIKNCLNDFDLIVLGFNDTSTLEGHFVLSPREREKRDRRERVEEMKERDREERGTGMKVKKQKK